MVSALTIFPIISASITAIVGGFYLLLYQRKPEYRIYWKFSLACFLAMAYAIASVGLYASDTAMGALTWRRVQTTALSLFTLSFMSYIVTYIQQNRGWIYRLIQISCVIAIFLQAFANNDLSWQIAEQAKSTRQIFHTTASFYQITPGIYSNIIFGIGLLAYLYIFTLTYRNRAQIPDRKKTFIYLSVLIFFAGFLNDALISFELINSIYLISVSLAVLLCLTAYSMIDTVLEDARLKIQLEQTNRQLENLTHEMENKILLRTDELRGMNTSLEERLVEINHLQADLREMAIHDSLTGFYNRHLLDEILEREFLRVQRQHFTSVVMIDIDHFKDLNDTHGHRSGDLVLQSLGRLLLSYFRQSDFIFRYGGDEFFAILPDMNQQAAKNRAEELCLIISRQVTVVDGMELNVTVSAGVTEINLTDGSPDDALARADFALYKAKSKGRNRVEFADEA